MVRRFYYGKGSVYVMVVDGNNYQIFLEKIDVASSVMGITYDLVIVKLIYV